jgi:hypothetical protein
MTDQADRIGRLFAESSPAERAAGAAWYPRARSAASALADQAPRGVGLVRTAGVIAALSPRARWSENLRNARAACEAAARVQGDPLLGELAIEGAVWHATEPVGLTDPRRKACRILNGEHPADVLGGPKVRAFWRNILGDTEAVTIDVWAQRAALGHWADHAPTGRRYDALADAYREAARDLGLPAPTVQATVWLHVRDQWARGQRALEGER